MFRISRAFCQTMTSILPIDLNRPSSCRNRIVAPLKTRSTENAILDVRSTEMRFTTFLAVRSIRLIGATMFVYHIREIIFHEAPEAALRNRS